MPRKIITTTNPIRFVNFAVMLPILCFIAAFGAQAQNGGVQQQQQQQQQQQDAERDLVPIFESSRPPATAGKTKKTAGKKQPPPNNKIVAQSNKSVYKRIRRKPDSGKITSADKPVSNSNNAAQNAAQSNRPPRPVRPNRLPQSNANDLPVARAQQIGVTIWQLFENQASAAGVSLADAPHKAGRLLTPRRVSFDTLFQNGDLVRLSIEAAKSGFLYIVNEELRADGTTGAPILVFPSKRINRGLNRIAPGKLIELPDLRGNPFYFELRPQNSDNQKLLAEILTVIVTDKPIANLRVGDEPQTISLETLRQWRGKWAGRAEIFESPSGDRAVYTEAERRAASGARLLTLADPLPNTVLLVENKRAGGALIAVPLWYAAEP